MSAIKLYIKNHKKSFYFRLLLLIYLIFSYNALPGWWYSLIGSFLIIYLARLIWDDYISWIGLRIKLKSTIGILLLLCLVVLLSYIITSWIARPSGAYIVFGSITLALHIIGYTLNEEMIIGAILLKYLQQRLIKLPNSMIALIVALVFSLLHFIFYAWIFQDKGLLNLMTLISLFAVGVIRNSLIFISGHIGYSWAIHAGWVFIMFGFNHLEIYSLHSLTEVERFNLYLGNPQLMVGLLGIAAIGLLGLSKHPSRL